MARNLQAVLYTYSSMIETYRSLEAMRLILAIIVACAAIGATQSVGPNIHYEVVDDEAAQFPRVDD